MALFDLIPSSQRSVWLFQTLKAVKTCTGVFFALKRYWNCKSNARLCSHMVAMVVSPSSTGGFENVPSCFSFVFLAWILRVLMILGQEELNNGSHIHDLERPEIDHSGSESFTASFLNHLLLNKRNWESFLMQHWLTPTYYKAYKWTNYFSPCQRKWECWRGYQESVEEGSCTLQ